MRTLHEILVEMKALVEELEAHIGKPTKFNFDSMDDQHVFAGSMDNGINFSHLTGATDTISLGEIKFDISDISNR